MRWVVAGLVVLGMLGGLLYAQGRWPGQTPARDPLAGSALGTAADTPVDGPLVAAQRNVAQAQRAGDRRAEGAALSALALLLEHRGKRAEAAETLLAAAALALDPAVQDEALWRRAADDLVTMGDTWRGQPGGGGPATGWLERLEALARGAKRRPDAAQIRHTMGSWAVDAGRYDEGRRWLVAAAAERHELKLDVPEAWSLNNLAFACLRAGDLDRAGTHCLEAYRLAKGRGMEGPAGKILENGLAIAEARRTAGAPDAAVAFWEEVEALAATASPMEHEQALLGRYQLMRTLRRLPQAEAALEEMLARSATRAERNRYVEGALWFAFATFLVEEASDPARALTACDGAERFQREIGDDLGLGWTMATRGRAGLRLAEAAQRTGDATALGRHLQAATGALEAAQKLFERCGEDRDGLGQVFHDRRDLEWLRGDQPAGDFYRDRFSALFAAKPPEPLPPVHFPAAAAAYAESVDQKPADAPMVRLERDGEGWLVTDLVDEAQQRVPFGWRVQVVHVRRTALELKGPLVRCGWAAAFVPRGGTAELARTGALHTSAR